MPDNDEQFVSYPLRLVSLTHIRETAITAIYENEDGTAEYVSVPVERCSIRFTDDSVGSVVFKRGLIFTNNLSLYSIIIPRNVMLNGSAIEK